MDEFPVRVEVRVLPGGPTAPEGAGYRFDVRRSRGAVIVTIPSDPRGPDRAIAKFPEQEEWLEEHAGDLVEKIWDVRWKFHDPADVSTFLDRIGASDSPPQEAGEHNDGD